MGETQLSGKKWLDYKWVIVILCLLMEMVCLGFCSSNRSIYVKAVTQAMGYERSAYAFSDTCRYVTTAVVNMFFGVMVLKLGEKKLILSGFASLIASMLCFAFATQLWMFYVAGALLGVGIAWTTTSMIGYVVGKWCKENKGTIMGLVMAGNGIGGAVAAQIVTPIIYEEGNAFGYRNAYRLVAVILAVMAVIILLFFRDAKGERSAADVPKKKIKGNVWVGISLKEATRRPFFYMAAGCILLTGLGLQSLVGINSAHMLDVGISKEVVATVASVHSLSLALFKFLTGVSYDKLGLRKTMLICDCAAVASIILLACVNPTPAGIAIAIAYGAVSSLALPLETIMVPLIAGDLFGEKDYSKILGIFVSINNIGYALSSPISNLVYDLTGSYVKILYVLAGVMVLVTVLFMIVISHSNRIRQELEAKMQ